MSLREVQEYIQNKKSLQPDAYKGNFILMENTDIEGQRAILAATDIQVQDSDEKTEAAGYSEADIAVCGGLELAPPWREGILQSQGIPLNFDVLGEGNTLQPKDGRPESYVEIITKVNEELYKAGRISAYQATAVRLSRKLQATLTSAEYFRQWNAAAIKKDAAYGLGVTPSLQHKGSPRACLETIFNSDLKFKNDISIREDLWPKRMKNETDTYSLRMVQEEIRILKALGVIVEGARPNTYRLRSQIRNLSPPELAPILALPELDRYTIPDTETIESLHGRIDEIVSAAYNARPKDVVVAGANEFGKKAAEKVAEEIRKLQKTPGKIITMVFATGNTQVSFLDELSRQTDIDWTRVQAYHLDEYKGLKPNHPASFAYYLNRNLFSKVAIPRDNIHYISEYVERYGEAKGFAEYLKDMSKPDITMTGVGRNAHLAFNEPGSSFNSTLRCVPLDEATVQANKADYPELETDAASRFAYSMGMANIFSSSKIFFLANGEKKAGVVAQAMYGDVTEYVPASMLQMHPNVTWILDKSAAGTSEAQGASIDENMAALDSECRQLLPSVDVGKILYHVIPESLVPEQIRGEMGKIARDTDSRRERIRIVPDKEFVSTLGALSQDKNNVILAAAPDAKVLSSLPKGVKALVFTGEIGGAFGFRQLEGIIAALRALERGDAAALSRIYRILTGSPFKGSQSDIVANIGDPKMLAMYMTFNLKPIVVEDYTELKRLNTRLLEFIRNA
jgi:glucosamine-6-phosphate deaminase